MKISIYSFIALIKFLLGAGVKVVLTNHFILPGEQYFGKQRGIGRRSDNPTIYTFGYNDNKIRMYKSNTQVLGNTSRKNSTENPTNVINNEPLPRRKRKKLSN